jgi:hypothetical protein
LAGVRVGEVCSTGVRRGPIAPAREYNSRIEETPRKDSPPSPRHNGPLLLLAVASVLAAGVALAMLFASVPPGDDSAEAVLDVSGLPGSGSMYLAHIHPGTCAEEEGVQQGGSAVEHGHSHQEHGATKEIEYPLSPIDPDAKGDGTSTTVVHHVTLEGLLSGGPCTSTSTSPAPGSHRR